MKKPVFYTEIAYFLGLFLLAWGTALTVWGDYGISMVVAPAYVLHLALSPNLPWFSFGVAEYVLQACILGIMMLLLRKFKFTYLLSFVAALIYGILLDSGMALFGNIFPAEPVEWQRVLAYVGGDAAVCAGVAMILRAYFPPEAYELFVKEVAPKAGLKIHLFKIVYDCVSLVIALLMSFALFSDVRGIDIGTVCCAFINGMLIKLFSNFYDRTLVFKDRFPLRKRFEKGEESEESV